MFRLQPIVALLTLALSTSSAHAQATSVKELFDNGQIHYDSEQYDLAIEAWAEAHRISGRAILLIKMAEAHEALGELDEAIALLQTYAEAAEDDEKASIATRIEALEAQKATLPAPEAPPDPEPDPPAEPSEPEPAPEPRRRPLALDLTLGGLTASGLGIGTGFGLSALSARKSAMESCAGPKDSVICTSSAGNALTRDRSASTIADIGFAVGGAAAVAWTVTLIAQPKAADLLVSPTPNGAVFTWRLR